MTMKTNLTHKVTRATLFAATLLAACLFAGAANAQSTFHGKFTLQHSVRWGQAVLSAGDYLITIDSTTFEGPLMAIIFDAKSGKKAAFVSCAITEDAKGDTALFISTRGNEHVVHTFRVAELGESFIFDPALAHPRATEEASKTEIVPVLHAKK
jgi:hypothetical protein